MIVIKMLIIIILLTIMIKLIMMIIIWSKCYVGKITMNITNKCW